MGDFLGVRTQPSVVEKNAWIVSDDFGNEVKEGETVFVLKCGATVHVDAVEDYLIEVAKAKPTVIDWDNRGTGIFVLPNGTWIKADDIEDYFIEVLDAQVYERKAALPKQNEQHPNS